MSPVHEWRWLFVGWLLFTASAIAFTIGAVRAGDVYAITGSLFFLVACLVFLVPVWVNRPTHNASE